MKKFNKHHNINMITIVLSCLFLLIIGFQNCAKNNGDGPNTTGSTAQPSESDPEVTGINDSNTPQTSWTWDCTSDHKPCKYHAKINKEATPFDFSNQDYITENSITWDEGDPEDVQYYLHIQAQNSENDESNVKIVQIKIVGQKEEKDPALVDQIDINSSHACSLSKQGKVKCWGNNEYGQLGYEDKKNRGDGATGSDSISGLADVDVDPTDDNHLTEFIAIGNRHTCALLRNKCIKCWGANDKGQLGYADTDNNFGDETNEMGTQLTPVGGQQFKVKTYDEDNAKKYAVLATGYDHTCAITDQDTVRCWGLNDKGQLGQGDTADTYIEPDNISDINIEPEDDTKTPAENAGFLPKHIATGAKHTCVMLDNSCVKCWGNNKHGQLGYGDTDDRGDEDNEMGADLPPVGGMDFKVKAIATGDDHTCAIMIDDKATATDSVQCWGLNDKGQLGLDSKGDTDNKVLLDTNNFIAVNLGQDRTAKSITAGAKHTCVTLDNDDTKCWGFNESGQLGQGDTDDRGDGDNEMGSLEKIPVDEGTVENMIAGGDSTCFKLDDGKVKCWGKNDHGQLAKDHTCSLGNGLGYSPSETGDKCNSSNNDVMGKTVNQIEYLSFE